MKLYAYWYIHFTIWFHYAVVGAFAFGGFGEQVESEKDAWPHQVTVGADKFSFTSRVEAMEMVAFHVVVE